MMPKKVANATQFLAIYNELDAHMCRLLKYKPGAKHSFMLHELANRDKKGSFYKYLFELLSYARLRNAIIHSPEKSTVEIIAEPHPDVVERYKKIRSEIINPIQAYSIAVKAQDIIKTTLDADVIEVMQVMRANKYNYIPVVDRDEKILGIFSPNVILSYLVKKDVIINHATKIKAFAEYLPCKNHKSEYFVFVPDHTLLSTVQKLFEDGIHDKKRLAVVFITENGHEQDRLLGMITAWDIAKNN